MQTARDAANRGGNVSRMMVVFSDGPSTANLNPDFVVRSANAFGIPIHPVILGHDRLLARAQGKAGGPGLGRQPTPGNVQGRGPQLRRGRNPQSRLNRRSNARRQENLQRAFAEFGWQAGGRSYDLEVITNKVMRRILGSLCPLAGTEYSVGYYPRAADEGLPAHAVRGEPRGQEDRHAVRRPSNCGPLNRSGPCSPCPCKAVARRSPQCLWGNVPKGGPSG